MSLPNWLMAATETTPSTPSVPSVESEKVARSRLCPLFHIRFLRGILDSHKLQQRTCERNRNLSCSRTSAKGTSANRRFSSEIWLLKRRLRGLNCSPIWVMCERWPHCMRAWGGLRARYVNCRSVLCGENLLVYIRGRVSRTQKALGAEEIFHAVKFILSRYS